MGLFHSFNFAASSEPHLDKDPAGSNWLRFIRLIRMIKIICVFGYLLLLIVTSKVLASLEWSNGWVRRRGFPKFEIRLPFSGTFPKAFGDTHRTYDHWQ